MDNSWYVSPALFPLVLGVLFILSGLCVFVRGMRGGGLPGIRAAFMRALSRLAQPPASRGVVVVLLMFAYYALLCLALPKASARMGWDGQNYIASSAVFLSASTLGSIDQTESSLVVERSSPSWWARRCWLGESRRSSVDLLACLYPSG